MSTHPRWFAAAAAAFAIALAGCGAAQEAPAAPASKAPMEPAAYAEATPTAGTTEDPLAELDRAEAELDSALGGGSGFAQPPGATPPPAQPLKETSPDAAAAQSSGDPCATACHALASMGRAADHLCGLSGEDDTRCEGARARVKNATDRVHAQCPACASDSLH